MNQLSEIGMNLFQLLETKIGWKKNEKSLIELYYCSLTSEDFALNALQLYIFLMVVEDEYMIRIDKNDLQKYGFRTLDNVEAIICSKQSHSRTISAI